MSGNRAFGAYRHRIQPPSDLDRFAVTERDLRLLDHAAG
jgi:hypothetical protein